MLPKPRTTAAGRTIFIETAILNDNYGLDVEYYLGEDETGTTVTISFEDIGDVLITHYSFPEGFNARKPADVYGWYWHTDRSNIYDIAGKAIQRIIL